MALDIKIDDEQLVQFVGETIAKLPNFIDELAKEVSEEVAIEASGVSTRLGAPWEVRGDSPTEREIVPPEWWAHFLSGGTQPHGPVHASKLTFTVDGNTVFADFVGGIAADHFDQRAVDNVNSRCEEIFGRVVLSG